MRVTTLVAAAACMTTPCRPAARRPAQPRPKPLPPRRCQSISTSHTRLAQQSRPPPPIVAAHVRIHCTAHQARSSACPAWLHTQYPMAYIGINLSPSLLQLDTHRASLARRRAPLRSVARVAQEPYVILGLEGGLAADERLHHALMPVPGGVDERGPPFLQPSRAPASGAPRQAPPPSPPTHKSYAPRTAVTTPASHRCRACAHPLHCAPSPLARRSRLAALHG